MTDNIDKLYKSLKEAGYNDIGSDAEFRQWIGGGSQNIDKLYNALNKEGYNDIGTREQFGEWIGVGNSAPQVETHQLQGNNTGSPDNVVINGIPTYMGELPEDISTSKVDDSDRQQNSWWDSVKDGIDNVADGVSQWLGGNSGIQESADNRAAQARAKERRTYPNRPQTKKNPWQDGTTDAEDWVQNRIDAYRAEQERIERENAIPIVEGVPESIAKTQGQWKKEFAEQISKTAKDITSGKADEAMKIADEAWQKHFMDDVASKGILHQAMALDRGVPIGDIRGSNEAMQKAVSDYANSYIESIQKQIESGDFQKRIQEESARLGINESEYAKQVADEVVKRFANELHNKQVERYMPQGDADFVIRGLENSIFGLITRAAFDTPEQVQLKDEATARYAENVGIGAKVGNMATGFVADAPFFGLTGKLSGAAVKAMAEKQLANLMARGVSRGAAQRALGAALENSFGRRAAQMVMQGVVGGSVNLGAYNTIHEIANQAAHGEFKPIDVVKAGAKGLATGAALGVGGGLVGSATANLSGIPKLMGQIGGFATEATIFAGADRLIEGDNGMTWTEQLAESALNLAVMKATQPGHLKQFINTITNFREAMRPNSSSDIKFTADEINEIKTSTGANSLLDGLTRMESVNSRERRRGGENKDTSRRRFSDEALNEAQSQVEKAYADFMTDPEVTYMTKQKVARLMGGKLSLWIPNAVGYDTKQEGENYTVTTRDKDGNAIDRKTIKGEDAFNEYTRQLQEAIAKDDVAQRDYSAELVVYEEIIKEGIATRKELDKFLRERTTGNEEKDRTISSALMYKMGEFAVNMAQPRGKGAEDFSGRRLEKSSVADERANDVFKDGDVEVKQQESIATDGTIPTTQAEVVETSNQVEVQERRATAYERGRSAVADIGSVVGLNFDVELANDRVEHVFNGASAEALQVKEAVVASTTAEEADNILSAENSGVLTDRQRKALETLVDSKAMTSGAEDAMQEQLLQAYNEQKAYYDAIKSETGHVVRLRLDTGEQVFYKKGQLDNRFGQVMVFSAESGETMPVATSRVQRVGVAPIGEVGNISEYISESFPLAEELLERDMTVEHERLGRHFNDVANGVEFMSGTTVNMMIDGVPTDVTILPTDPLNGAVQYTVNATGQTRQMPIADASRAFKESLELRKQNALAEEDVAENQERFANTIVGFKEGMPDISASATDVQSAAQWLRTQNVEGKEPLEYISEQNAELTNKERKVQSYLTRQKEWLEIAGDSYKDIERKVRESFIEETEAELAEIKSRQQKLAEVRNAYMTPSERAQLVAERTTLLNELQLDVDKAHTPKPTEAPVAMPTEEELSKLPKADQLENVGNRRKELLRYKQEVLDKNAQDIDRKLDEYKNGYTDLMESELTNLIQERKGIEDTENAILNRYRELKALEERIKALPDEIEQVAEGIATDDMVQQRADERVNYLSGARTLADLRKRAEKTYGELLGELEPLTLEEHIATALTPHSILWESERGEATNNVIRRGLKDETGFSTKADGEAIKYFTTGNGKGASLDEIAEGIWSDFNDSLAGQYDTQDVKNALLDMLSSAQRASDITRMVLNNRIAQAEEQMRAMDEEESQYIKEEQEALHERELWFAAQTEILKELSLKEDDINKIYGIFAEAQFEQEEFYQNLLNKTKEIRDDTGRVLSEVPRAEGRERVDKDTQGRQVRERNSESEETLRREQVGKQVDVPQNTERQNPIARGEKRSIGNNGTDGELRVQNEVSEGNSGVNTAKQKPLLTGDDVLAEAERRKALADEQEKKQKLAELKNEYDRLSERADEIELEWQEKRADYLYANYPTQATTSARTNSPEGKAEREALKKDKKYQKILSDEKEAVDKAIKELDEVGRRIEELEQKPIQMQVGVADEIVSFANEYGINEQNVRDYASAMKRGSLQGAAYAERKIEADIVKAHNYDFKSLGEYVKIKNTVLNPLRERFGNIEDLRAEAVRKAEEERGLMEAAKKKAQEEAEAQQKHLDELATLSEKEIDSRYFNALEAGNETEAREMLDEVARRRGYDNDKNWKDGHTAPSMMYKTHEERQKEIENGEAPDVSLEDIALGVSTVPADYFTNPRGYMYDTATGLGSQRALTEAMAKVKRGEKADIKVYRAVPTKIKESSLRSGDWVTPNRAYAEMHGNHRFDGKYRIIEQEVPAEQLWWDGNDINEWGFDDGKSYKYKNVKNNRKSDELITRDDKGNVIPPSKRFNQRKSDTRYQVENADIEAVNERFNEQLSAYKNGNISANEMFRLGMPIGVMQQFLPNIPIVMRQSAVNKGTAKKHNVDIDALRNMPQMIAEPMMIFQRSDNAIGILTEMQDRDGKNVCVAIEVSRKIQDGGEYLEVNDIRSFHGREIENIVSPILNNNTLKWVDKKKSLAWLSSASQQVQQEITKQELSSVAKIIENFDNPKLPTENNSATEQQRLLGEVAVDLLRGAGIDVVMDESAMRDVLEASEQLQEMTVYHGSGAEFEAFDHSHMGEGEGAQAYGWGTYVTEVNGIARSYAEQAGKPIGYSFANTTYKNVNQLLVALQKELNLPNVTGEAFFQLDNVFQRYLYQLLTYGKDTAIDNMEYSFSSIGYENSVVESMRKIFDASISSASGRYLYTVEIPEDNGNYLEWDKVPTDEQADRLISFVKEYGYDIEDYVDLQGDDFRKSYKGLTLRFADIAREMLDNKSISADNAISELLSRAGFTGIKYPADYQRGGREDGAKNYVIFNEKDAKIMSREQFLRTAKGEVYGFVKDGKVYLDPKLLNPNTPIHEYTHLWDTALQKANPELWKRGVELMKGTSLWESVQNDPAYKDIASDENLLASEVHARLTGAEGEKILDQMYEEAKAEQDGVKKIEKLSLLARLRAWVKDAWKWIKDTMTPWSKEEASAVTLDDFVNMPVKDLFEGKRIDIESDGGAQLRILDDKADVDLIAKLNSEPQEKVYRAMALIDGKLYPPMATYVEKANLNDGVEIGEWVEADERPDLITWKKDKAYFRLRKPDGSTVDARYNPYIHTSRSPLNDQFSSAQSRPEIVIVETEVPTSELTSGYKAEGAKDTVGEMDWKSGGVSAMLPADKKRKVILSRWGKPVRIVPYSEVADRVQEMFDGIDVTFPSNVLHPELREELEKRGYKVVETDNQGKPVQNQVKPIRYRFSRLVDTEVSESEKAERIEKLRNSAPAVITGNEIEASDDFKQYKKNALEYGKKLQGTYTNKDTGFEVQLQRGRKNGGLREVLQHDYKDKEHLQSIAAIPQIIENGVYIMSEPNFDTVKNPDVVEYQHYVSGLKIGNEDYTVRSVYAIDKKGNRYYDHKLTNIEKGKLLELIETQAANPNGFGATPDTKSTTDIFGKDKRLVSILQANMREKAAESAKVLGEQLGGVGVALETEASNLPDEVRTAIENGTVKGWFDPNDNSVHLYMPAIESVDDAQRTVFHEKLGHEGLKALLGSDEAVMAWGDFIFKSASKDIRQRIIERADAEGYDWKDHQRFSKAAQEVFSDIAGDGPRSAEEFSLWRKVKHYLIKALKAMGIKVRGLMNDHDLRYYVLRTAEALKKGKNEEGRLNNSYEITEEDAMRGDILYSRMPRPKPLDNESKIDYIRRLREWQDAKDEKERLMQVVDGNEAKERKIDINTAITQSKLLHAKYDTDNKKARKDALDAVYKDLREISNAIATSNVETKETESAIVKDAKSVAQIQKAYDRATVKAVVDTARMLMHNGFLDNMGTRETSRLLTLVKDANGKQSANKEIEGLMDLMVSNVLRRAEKDLEKSMQTKETKIDNSGVEVQAKLDLRGQTAIRALREYKGKTKEQIDERMAELLKFMQSLDDAVVEKAYAEYMGLKFAKEYVDGVVDSENEFAGLEKDMEDSKAEFATYKAEVDEAIKRIDENISRLEEEARRETGNDAVEQKRITDNIKAYKAQKKEWKDKLVKKRQALADLKAYMIDTKRSNLLDRAQALQNLSERVAEKIAESRDAAKEFRMAEIERAKEVVRDAALDLQNVELKEHRAESEQPKFMNNSVVSFFLRPLGTFDTMLRMFGSNSADGEGALFRRFMPQWQKANDKHWHGVYNATQELNAKVSEVMGKEMKWSGLYSLSNKKSNITVEFWNGTDLDEVTLTQGNALYIYMADKMADGAMKLRWMGIREEDVERIKEQLDPRFIELADWVQSEFLPSKRNKYNHTHEQLFGASMASVENYFPLQILSNAREGKVDIGMASTDGEMPSTKTGSIVKRTKNRLPLDVLNTDAFSLVAEHIDQMEKWNAYAQFNKDVNTLLNDKTFRNKVQGMSTIYGAGKQLFDNFRATAEIAAETYQTATGKKANADKAFLNIAKGITTAKVSFRVFTAFKQLTSFPAFIGKAGLCNMAYSYLMHPKESWDWAMENMPQFHKRWHSRQAGNEKLRTTDADWALWRNNIVETATRYGMTPNAFVDAVTVSCGGYAVYRAQKKEYLKQGYSEYKAEEKAKFDASVVANESQQSSEGAYMSAMQVDRTFFSNLFTIFRNASMGYQRKLVNGIMNLNRMWGEKGYKEKSINFMARQMEAEGAFENVENIEERRTLIRKAAERRYNKSMWQSIVDVFIFGFGMQFFWNLSPSLIYKLFGGGADDEDNNLSMTDMVEDAAQRAALGGWAEGLSGGAQISEAIGTLAGGGSWRDIKLFPEMPIVSDVNSVMQKMDNSKAQGINELLNVVVQSTFGGSPQIVSDVVVAIADAFNGDLEAMDEFKIFLLRTLQVPQSQIEKIYFDEIKMSAKDARNLPIDQLARRYAKYKYWRSAGVLGFMEREARDANIQKGYDNFMKKATERANGWGDKAINAEYDAMQNVVKENAKKVKTYKALVTSDPQTYKGKLAEYDTPQQKIAEKYKTIIADKTKAMINALDEDSQKAMLKEVQKLKADAVAKYEGKQSADFGVGVTAKNPNEAFFLMATPDLIAKEKRFEERKQAVKANNDKHAERKLKQITTQYNKEKKNLLDPEKDHKVVLEELESWLDEAENYK